MYKTSLHFALFKNGDTASACDGSLRFDYTEGYRYATESEKQHLFDALTKEGKRWNEEKKRIEDLPRWRAEEGIQYYFIDRYFEVAHYFDLGTIDEDKKYHLGNYFKTEEAAERVSSQIREIFKKSKAE